MKKLALAYCADNLPEAQVISDALQYSDYEIEHFHCKSSTSQASLADQISHFEGTAVILLISDNFLKSISCMNRALNLLQQKTVRILPVIVDGFIRDENTGEMVPTVTQFERIGDIIPYINYWQNQYLDLRSQKKRLEQEEGLDHDAFHNHLRMLREVSSEASEFLRLLRNIPHFKGSDFKDDHFEALFNFLEDPEGWENFKENWHTPTPVAEAPGTGSVGYAEMGQGDEILPVLPGALPQESSENYPHTGDLDAKLAEETGMADTEKDNLLGGTEEVPAFVAPLPENTDDSTSQTEVSEGDFSDLTRGDMETNEDEEEPVEAGPADDSNEIPVEETVHPDRPNTERSEIEAILLQAVNLANSGNHKDCVEYLQHAVDTYPASVELRYHYALELAHGGGDYNPAIGQLLVILDQNPLDEQANYLVGELYELQQRSELAAEYYNRVAEINPDFPDIFYRLGLASLQSDQVEPEKVARFFKKACKANPAHVDAHYQYALICAELPDKEEKTEKYLHKTLDLDPAHPFANYDLALLYHRGHAMGRAKKFYLRAIEINPELKTIENDLAFGVVVPEIQPPSAPEILTSSDTLSDQDQLIQTLKANIAKLEEILHSQVSVSEPKKEEMPGPVKTVCITGASSGIGRATAEVFAQNGYRLILTARRAELLQETCRALHEQYGSACYPLVFDVRDAAAVQQAIQQLPPEWQEIDLLINNAGKAKGLEPFQEGRMEHWEEMIDTNIKGLLYMSRAIAPGMVARKKGHIINIGSIAGKEVYPRGNVYCASKAAVDALTTGMRLDLHSHHIRVSQVNPGHVEETEFALVRFDGDSERAKIYEDFKPLTARDVANTIFFIASQPDHVNIQDVVMYSTQQASATVVDRSGR
jgi:NADP-dependent 3-hydroxy acid dehydrogenase YdfG/tetratricopeptide (TPR) repeat protein